MLPGLPGMITLANQRDDNWPISKYQETPAANQPLPTLCLCSKLINKYCCKSGLGALAPLHCIGCGGGPWLKLEIKPLHAFALPRTPCSLSFGDSDSGQNIWGLVRDPFNWEE